MLLNNLSLFVKIVEKGSLVAAGRELGLSSTTVSERLAALEAHYGVVLLNRTTRAISLTDEGRTLFTSAKTLLGEVEDLDTRIRLGSKTLSGHIRLSAPSDLGQAVVVPVVNRFLEEHSAVSVELILTDGYVDLVRESIDIALRFGPTSDSSLRIRRLSARRRLVCAAPKYLENQGMPKKPVDLKKHNCIVMRFGTELDNIWHFGPDTMKQIVAVHGDRISNDGAVVRKWCLDGYGIAKKSELDVYEDIQTGHLIPLLTEFTAPETPMQLLFPPSRAQPRRVRELADLLSVAFESTDKQIFYRNKETD